MNTYLNVYPFESYQEIKNSIILIHVSKYINKCHRKNENNI